MLLHCLQTKWSAWKWCWLNHSFGKHLHPHGEALAKTSVPLWRLGSWPAWGHSCCESPRSHPGERHQIHCHGFPAKRTIHVAKKWLQFPWPCTSCLGSSSGLGIQRNMAGAEACCHLCNTLLWAAQPHDQNFSQSFPKQPAPPGHCCQLQPQISQLLKQGFGWKGPEKQTKHVGKVWQSPKQLQQKHNYTMLQARGRHATCKLF